MSSFLSVFWSTPESNSVAALGCRCQMTVARNITGSGRRGEGVRGSTWEGTPWWGGRSPWVEWWGNVEMAFFWVSDTRHVVFILVLWPLMSSAQSGQLGLSSSASVSLSRRRKNGSEVQMRKGREQTAVPPQVSKATAHVTLSSSAWGLVPRSLEARSENRCIRTHCLSHSIIGYWIFKFAQSINISQITFIAIEIMWKATKANLSPICVHSL